MELFIRSRNFGRREGDAIPSLKWVFLDWPKPVGPLSIA